jgi:hypothetical protein
MTWPWKSEMQALTLVWMPLMASLLVHVLVEGL